MFTPILDILPTAQQALWTKLGPTPTRFVLYGGTALALRLGHRQSVDFDFFSNETLIPQELLHDTDYLREARIDQRKQNTLTVTVGSGDPVQLSFFGDVGMRSVEPPDLCDNGVQIASLIDLAATKLKTIQQRAEMKDYVDLGAAFSHGVTLPYALAAAVAIYGRTFNPVAALKALSYYGDGNLPQLPALLQRDLSSRAQQVDLSALPYIASRPGITLGDQP